MKKSVGIIWGIFAFLCLASGGCKDPGAQDKEAISWVVEACAQAVEAGDREWLKEQLHLDYRDRFGHDRNTIADRLMLMVSEMSDLDVIQTPLSFEALEPETGMARIYFKVDLKGTGRPRGPAWEEMKRRNIVLEMRKVGNRWFVVKGDLGIDLMGAVLQ